MPVFTYRGRTRMDGKMVAGTLEAEDVGSLVMRLRQQGIIPSSIRLRSKALSRDFGKIQIKFGAGVRQKELAVFTRQFSTMINAGLPLIQCLDILAAQTPNKNFKEIILAIKKDVEAGSTFAKALSNHPKLFDDLFVNMVSAGEAGGILDTILNRLATYIEKAQALKGKIIASLFYPAAVSVLAIGIVAALLIFIVPTFASMFEGLGASLPAPTQILLNLSNFLRSKIVFFVGFLIVAAVGFRQYRHTSMGSFQMAKLSLSLPVFGDLVRKTSVARFTRTLGTLVSSGVPILDALEITARTSGNKVIEKAVMATREGISGGENIAEPLKRSQVFPPMVVQMIAVGEQTGALDAMLQKIAEFYEQEVDTTVEGLTSLIEPILLVFLGGVCGAIVISLFLPIITMSTAIK